MLGRRGRSRLGPSATRVPQSAAGFLRPASRPAGGAGAPASTGHWRAAGGATRLHSHNAVVRLSAREPAPWHSGQPPQPYGQAPVIYQPVQIPKDLPAPGGDAVRHDNRVPGEGLGPGIPEGVIPPVGTADPRGFIAPAVPAQPPAEKNKRLIRASVLQEALLIHRVQPVYPPLAIQIRLEGTVRLRAIIGRDGAIDSLELLSGHPILARAALDSVSQWRYRPTLLGGEPVEVETIITLVFTFLR